MRAGFQPGGVGAAEQVVTDDLHRDADAMAGDLVACRRDLHRHPELGFQERRTAAVVESRLRQLGLEVRPGVAETGVVGVLRAPGERRGGAVLLRADMDALPIQEVPGRDYGSHVPGRMHACGHDGHTAMLLGAAVLLCARREGLPRDVVFCFQPAEEGLGGALRMIEAGVLDDPPVRSAYALHLWTGFPAGSVHLRAGPIMAAQDEFTARILGRGGHGALPHRSVDPVVATAHGVVALQCLVSREIDPFDSAVVSVGRVEAGSAANVIPEEARLDGTLRSFSDDARERLRERVPAILEATARAHRCRLLFDLRPGYPAVVNDSTAVDRAREAASRTVGPDRVAETPPLAAAEDFAYFLEKVPGAFVFLGAGNEDRGITAPHHSPEFDIDESALPRGAELLARLALTG